MQRYDRAQIIAFLHAVDRHLKNDLRIVVVGGTAAMVGYHADTKTADMDVYTYEVGSKNDLQRAARAAFQETGIQFLIGDASVADLPYNYKDRDRPVRGVAFKKLTVLVPDKYDLVLSKTLRGYAHDLEAIRSIHEQHPLSETTLAKRFETESWKVAVGDSRKYAFNMVLVMRLLYGERVAKRHSLRWGITT